MGLFSIVFASLLIPRRAGERLGDPEDPEKGRREVGIAEDNDDNDDGQRRRDPGSNGDLEDDSVSIHDPDVNEDEPEEPPQPGRRVTFGSPSGESGPPSEKGDTKPGLFSRLKAAVFPSHDEDKPLSNYRILPIISGVVIPFSILLEIPGITESWYIRTDGHVTVQTKPNTTLLDVGLAVSMFYAVVANISLVCRFLEKGPVLVTTMVTIVSLTIHGNVSLRNFTVDCVLRLEDLINVTALVVFGVLHRFDDGFTYGQGYWMTGMCTAPEFFSILIYGFSVFYDCVHCHQHLSDMGSAMDAEFQTKWYGHLLRFCLPVYSDVS